MCENEKFFFFFLKKKKKVRQLGATLEQEDFDAGVELLPGSGSVRFEGVSAAYRPDLPLVLEDLSFSIAPGEKVAICGRTGSGKSTLGRVLLRMLE